MTEVSEEHRQLIGKSIANNKYLLTSFIGSGSFSLIFKVREVKTNKELVVKLEAENTNNPQLGHEFRIYQLLRYECKHWSIPKTYFFGSFLTYRALVVELLGPNIADKFQECGQIFTIKTVTQLALQLIDIFQYIHSRRVIYRDVKPENFLLGLPETQSANKVHVVDFGLAKEYRDRDGVHIPYREGVGITGTVRYISINTHLNREQSRRDDMEAIGHLLIYFLRGSLPWSGLNIRDQFERFTKIGEIKQKTKTQILCTNLYKEYEIYLKTVRSLKFTEEPNYQNYKQMFENLMLKLNLINDNKYDWNDSKRKLRESNGLRTESNIDIQQNR